MSTSNGNGIPVETRHEVARRIFLEPWDPVEHGPPPKLADVERALEVPDRLGDPDRFHSGGAFILDAPEKVPAIWGRDDEVLWPEGEPFLLVGPDGVGKGTTAQQLALGLVGLPRYIDFLGFPINPAKDGVLYVAADRPNQIARSFRRMVVDGDRAMLDELLTVHHGPPPVDIGSEPDKLVPWLEQQQRGTIILDSFGAMISDPASDETGSGVFRSLMEATSAGYEILALYHPRKAEQGAPKRVHTVADVYGSRWITAGAGSVLYLDGQPGDIVITARHLKQPAGEVGPLTLKHDHSAGRTMIYDTPDILDLAVSGITVKDAAVVLFETETPNKNEIEKARRRLEKLADRGDLGRTGEMGEPTIYTTVVTK